MLAVINTSFFFQMIMSIGSEIACSRRSGRGERHREWGNGGSREQQAKKTQEKWMDSMGRGVFSLAFPSVRLSPLSEWLQQASSEIKL